MLDVTAEEIQLQSTAGSDGHRLTRLSVPTMHCGGCMSKVEKALTETSEVLSARVNLTGKYVDIVWHEGVAPNFFDIIKHAGHTAHFQTVANDDKKSEFSGLLRATAVAGFAASNIMLLSVAVWSGAGGDYRQLFHLISAAIALPTLIYAGQPFFQSAWRAVRNATTNMDVPITIGVILAFSMSMYDALAGGKNVYFDASAMLLFFLLIGRTLDQFMREKVRGSITGLAQLIPLGAAVQTPNGDQFMPVANIRPGMKLIVLPGDRIPLDGRVVEGSSEIDCALVTGESISVIVQSGAEVLAGTRNLSQRVLVEVTRGVDQSFLSQTIASMEQASNSKTTHRRLADQAAQWFAPFVHTAAFLSFMAWIYATGDWHQSLTIAVAVLIITCPCALGLAAPIVQIIAARRLFDFGVLTRDGTSLERLASIDTVVFDKTGTLTQGVSYLENVDAVPEVVLASAASLASHSRHPYSQAITQASNTRALIPTIATEIVEHMGGGVEGVIDGATYRLGKSQWAGGGDRKDSETTIAAENELVLTMDGQVLWTFDMSERLANGAKECSDYLQTHHGLSLSILSGDQEHRVQKMAALIGIKDYRSTCEPTAKLNMVQELASKGHSVLMVGDGLNDTPAMAAAHVSIAPASAAEIGRSNADFVFTNGDLTAIGAALEIAKRSNALIKQNFAIAVMYNVLAVPLAVLGYVTPLIAAVSMSLSSIIVILNALRLKSHSIPINSKGRTP